jgi:hypothetical protein
MIQAPFEKTNLFWQWQQFRQQVGEWLEALLRDLNVPTDTPLPNLEQWWNFLFWGLVMLLALLIGWWLYRWASLSGFPRWRSTATPRPTQPKLAPFKTAQDWLKTALAYQNRSNYREACRALYLAMLQRLDERKLISQRLSRTDGEYEQLVRDLPTSQACHTLIAIHERLCFSDSEISALDFRTCHQAYQDLESL